MAEMILIVVFGSLAVVLVWRVHDRLQARRLVRLKALSDDFYPRAQRALTHPDLTDEVRRFVMLIARSVAEPNFAWLWARAFLAEPKTAARGIAPGDDALVRVGPLGVECIEVALVGLEFMAELHPLPGLMLKREVASMRRKIARGPIKQQKVADRLVAYERRLEAA